MAKKEETVSQNEVESERRLTSVFRKDAIEVNETKEGEKKRIKLEGTAWREGWSQEWSCRSWERD